MAGLVELNSNLNKGYKMAGYNGLYDLSSQITQPSIMGTGYQQSSFGLPRNKNLFNNINADGSQMSVMQNEPLQYNLDGSLPTQYIKPTPPQSTGLWDSIKGWAGDMFNTTPNSPGGKSNAEMTLGGISALGSLYGAYNTKNYQDKMAKLQEQAQGLYNQQVQRQNQRQDLAQANYNKAMGV